MNFCQTFKVLLEEYLKQFLSKMYISDFDMYTYIRNHSRLRASLDYGQTSRWEAFGPMKMQKCPKSVLSAFTLEAEVQRMSPPKEPSGNTFRKLWRQKFGLWSKFWVEQNARPKLPSRGQTSVGRPFKYPKFDSGLFQYIIATQRLLLST